MTRPTVLFVDDEPNVLNGLKRFCRSQRHLWDMHFESGGEAALSFLKGNNVDVVVSDMRMPGVTGADLFERISGFAPGIIRIILSGEAEQEQTIRTIGRSHRFLAKPCDPEALIDAINAPLTLRGGIDRSLFDREVSYLDRLKSPARIFGLLEETLRQPDAEPADVASVIKQDPNLAARLLQLVNSAYFGRPVLTCSLEKAVEIIGCDRLLTLLENGRLGSHDTAQACNDRLEQHRISAARLATACLELAVAEGANEANRDLAFAAGLFAELGYDNAAAGQVSEIDPSAAAFVASYTTTLLGLPRDLSTVLQQLSRTAPNSRDPQERARSILNVLPTIEAQAA